MADFNSDIANTPARAPRFGGVIGRRAKAVVPAGTVTTDVLTLCQLPKGAVVMRGTVYHDNIATTSFDVGLGGGTIDSVAEDVDAYIDGATGANTTPVEFTQGAGLVDRGPLDAERPLIMTFNTGNPTTGADIAVVVEYMLSA